MGLGISSCRIDECRIHIENEEALAITRAQQMLRDWQERYNEVLSTYSEEEIRIAEAMAIREMDFDLGPQCILHLDWDWEWEHYPSSRRWIVYKYRFVQMWLAHRGY